MSVNDFFNALDGRLAADKHADSIRRAERARARAIAREIVTQMGPVVLEYQKALQQRRINADVSAPKDEISMRIKYSTGGHFGFAFRQGVTFGDYEWVYVEQLPDGKEYVVAEDWHRPIVAEGWSAREIELFIQKTIERYFDIVRGTLPMTSTGVILEKK